METTVDALLHRAGTLLWLQTKCAAQDVEKEAGGASGDGIFWDVIERCLKERFFGCGRYIIFKRKHDSI